MKKRAKPLGVAKSTISYILKKKNGTGELNNVKKVWKTTEDSLSGGTPQEYSGECGRIIDTVCNQETPS